MQSATAATAATAITTTTTVYLPPLTPPPSTSAGSLRSYLMHRHVRETKEYPCVFIIESTWPTGRPDPYANNTQISANIYDGRCI